jgi:benzil reductase ((S)-benzoin forming)
MVSQTTGDIRQRAWEVSCIPHEHELGSSQDINPKETLMENGFFLITGTSRGIGEALAQKLLGEGNTVLGVARGRSGALKSTKYHHLSYDLADSSAMSQIMEKVDEVVNNQRFDFICLVNSASPLEPVGAIEKCPANEIESHVRICLIASMILTSLFIRRFSDDRVRKKVAFITGGSASTAAPHESIYCGAKAGLTMFAQCIGLEQNQKEYGFEVITIGPGMVDTYMHQVARSKNKNDYVWADLCKQVFEEGKLQAPADAAEEIYSLLEHKFEQGLYVQVSEATPVDELIKGHQQSHT